MQQVTGAAGWSLPALPGASTDRKRTRRAYGGLPQVAANFRPSALTAKAETDRSATIAADRIAELDRKIDAIKSQWKKNSRDQDWIERMRREIDHLEDEKARVKDSLTCPNGRRCRISGDSACPASL